MTSSVCAPCSIPASHHGITKSFKFQIRFYRNRNVILVKILSLYAPIVVKRAITVEASDKYFVTMPFLFLCSKWISPFQTRGARVMDDILDGRAASKTYQYRLFQSHLLYSTRWCLMNERVCWHTEAATNWFTLCWHFKFIFMYGKCCILVQRSTKSVSQGPRYQGGKISSDNGLAPIA